ncbi:tetratricopeptide repeat protein [bacterium BMS3Bbin11]|nr:tetratricopeptide repeat protein [bacterium BMS3Abin11]GBE46694.1 tetratricopeptide repeat protein [bacterium BMS3Bbin11]HDH08350.1 lipopolysaccharide assembly protein LapB [Gammaproteobacteria bacterium]HDH16894.1 lipopolysaccharide assembly protein LapB [Gammaproteobacteria bacterium]HDZ78265.1 lipopolysaccharide assembly protein LapB [Gammaproteobacteria bacterium]
MFDVAWLLLLLPVAVISGWIAARQDQRSKKRKGTGEIPSDYFKGLNLLLNEQPDKAIEVFIKVLEVDTETVETHLMLGNLFRRRGEIERATRIHQNLIARPKLDCHQRSQALFELAQDYLKAGLLDRAENLLLEYAEIEKDPEPALRQLLYVYQQEKEWDQAIATAKRLARASGESVDEMIAHFLCEQAEDEIGRNNPDQAKTLLKKALSKDPDSVRANILRGQIARDAGDCKKAIRYWKKIENQDRRYLPEVLGQLSECFKETGNQDAWLQLLNKALEKDRAIPVMLKLAEEIEANEGSSAAREFVIEELRLQPSMHGLSRMIHLSAAQADGQSKSDLETLEAIIERVLKSRKNYLCEHCGFRGNAMHWQCPGCKRWNTVKPVWDDGDE